MKLYVEEPNVLAGITLKDLRCPEDNNMAFHTAEEASTVVENRSRLAQKIMRPLDSFVCADQRHSDHIYKVTKEDRGRGAKNVQSAIPNTDALYTTENDIVLCTFTADCVPVFLYNKHANIIGIIHSGWNGTIKEITAKTLLHIQKNEVCNITDFHIQIGTALSQKRFEVDEDVFLLFDALNYADEFIAYNNETNKYHIDNQEVVATQCERIGVPPSQITIDQTCTFDSSSGFSYREDRQSGRHLGFIYQK